MRKIVALLLTFSLAAPAQVIGTGNRKVFTPAGGIAIAFDNSNVLQQGSAPIITYSYTVGSGTNRMLFVGVGAAATTVVPTVTYAGSSMTLLKSQNWFFGGGMVYIFGLVAPTSGANNVIITFASGTVTVFSSAASYTGVLQNITPDATTSTTGSATSTTLTLTTIANNCWTFSFVDAANADTLSAGTGATQRTAAGPGPIANASIFDSNGPKTPAGSTSQIVNITPSGQFGAVMVSFTHA